MSMTWTFSDIYTKVAKFLGLKSNLSDAELAKVKDIVYRGYLEFLFPIHPETGEAYHWSFLKKDATLTLRNGEYIYLLPKDYFTLDETFVYVDDNNRVNLTKVTPSIIKQHRSTGVVTGEPWEFAIRYAKYDKSFGYQPQEVLFYPTPTSEMTLTYSYIFIPAKPELDTDYFVGNVMSAEAILETCLAVAEQQEDESSKVHAQKASDIINKLILNDEPSAADTVGMVIDSRLYSQPFTSGRRRDTGSITSVYGISNVNKG